MVLISPPAHKLLMFMQACVNACIAIIVRTMCTCGYIQTLTNHLALVVQTLDSAIHRINLYPADSVIDFRNTYPLDSDLSGG